MNQQIYLDFNSTTPIDESVAQRIHDVHRMQWMNPSSQHQTGQAARRFIEDAKQNCLRLIGAKRDTFPADEMYFTSGGTESNNLAVLGMTRHGQQLIISDVEHPSVAEAANEAARRGALVRRIPVDSNGVIRLEKLGELLESAQTSLVSVIWVNNETGVIQPVDQIAELCRMHQVPLHLDAVQAVGKIPVHFRQCGADLLTITPHKFYGPRGIAGLVAKPGIQLTPFIFGGHQQLDIRPGTLDAALISGMELSLEKAVTSQQDHWNQLLDFRSHFLERLYAECTVEVFVNGDLNLCSPHTLNLSFPGIERQTLLLAGDVAGLAFSTGSACSSGSSEPSPVLVAMGLGQRRVESAIRLSFGKTLSVENLSTAACVLSEITSELKQF
ncbi:MAG: cysteine desulfurase family protein [Pirellulaceae bacterium]